MVIYKGQCIGKQPPVILVKQKYICFFLTFFKVVNKDGVIIVVVECFQFS